ncbi:MAG: type II toxin-antitoxin system VapB family antitoxin [Peptococcaceae bacterium]|nr:type II toxin-antitoxin system VapB family antitoxin [Peptococcaceae bacterium]
MRTNIMIDDLMMQKAMEISGLKTKKEVVAKALKEFIERHTRKDLRGLRGKIEFAENYDYLALRKDR